METISYNNYSSGFDTCIITISDMDTNKVYNIDYDLYEFNSINIGKDFSISFIYDTWFASFWKKLLTNRFSIDITFINNMRDRLIAKGPLYPKHSDYFTCNGQLYIKCIFSNMLEIKEVKSDLYINSCILGD